MRADQNHPKIAGLLLWSCRLILFATLASNASAQPATQPVDFSKQIAPVLVRQCLSCHGAEKAKGKYRLDTLDRLTTAGEGKTPPVVAGRPDQSELYRRITTSDDDDRMPQKADKLPDAQIALIERWIKEGASTTGVDAHASLASVAGEDEPVSPEIYRTPLPITAIAFAPGGSEIAVSGYHEVTVWNSADGKLLRRIQRLPQRIWGLAYSPDGRLLAVAGGTPGLSGSITLCDARGHWRSRVLDRISDMMLAVSFSPDGTRLAAGGADNIVRVFDVNSGRRELLIEQHADWVTDLAFSPDGEKIATASRDQSARVFDAKTGVMESAYLKHEESLTGVCWSTDGKQLFTAGRDRKVHAWNPADAKPAGQIEGFNGDPFKIASEPSMVSHVAGEAISTKAPTHPPATGAGKTPATVPATMPHTEPAQTPGRIFVCSADGLVRSYSAVDHKLAVTFAPAPDWIYCLSVDAATHRVAGGCYNGEVIIWDAENGKILSRFFASPGYVSSPTAK